MFVVGACCDQGTCTEAGNVNACTGAYAGDGVECESNGVFACRNNIFFEKIKSFNHSFSIVTEACCGNDACVDDQVTGDVCTEAVIPGGTCAVDCGKVFNYIIVENHSFFFNRFLL